MRDFRMTDWGEPPDHEKDHLRGVTIGNIATDEDFRDSDWGNTEEAVVTPGANVTKPELTIPDEGANKPIWEEYAKSQGFDTTGLNKQQIKEMVTKEYEEENEEEKDK